MLCLHLKVTTVYLVSGDASDYRKGNCGIQSRRQCHDHDCDRDRAGITRYGHPGLEGRAFATDSVRIPLTLSGLQYFCYKVNIIWALCLSCVNSYHSLTVLTALVGTILPIPTGNWGLGRANNPGKVTILVEPSSAPNPMTQGEDAFLILCVDTVRFLGKSLEKASKVGFSCCSLQKKVSCGSGLGRKKESSVSNPKADPAQPPENAGSKNEITPIKYSAFPGRRMMWKCEPLTPTPGLGRTQIRKPGPGGPPAAPGSVHWLSKAPVPCRHECTSLNTWFTPRG